MTDPNIFIAAYSSTDVAIVLQTRNNTGDDPRRVKGFNVCKYLDSGIDGSTIWILLEGGEKLSFSFDNSMLANIAMNNFRAAIDTLSANCAVNGGTPIPEATVISLPLEGAIGSYKALVTANTVVPLQWYDIRDENGVLGKGTFRVFRCLATSTDDGKPQGVILDAGSDNENNEKVIIDVIGLKLAEDINPGPSYYSTNKSIIVPTGTNSYLYASNNSSLTAQDCSYISVDHSIVSVNTCNNIKAFNSSIKLVGCQNCVFDGVTADLSAAGNFNDIVVNKSDSKGKVGEETISFPVLLNTTLSAYQSSSRQTLEGTLIANGTVTLANSIKQANAEFTLIIDAAAVLNGYAIAVKDSTSGNTLTTLNSSYLGKEVIFVYDVVTDNFYLKPSSGSNEKRTAVTVIVDSQVNFTNVLDFIPQYPDLSELVINSCVQNYGVDYTISNRNLTWTSTDFNLKTTDQIFIIYK